MKRSIPLFIILTLLVYGLLYNSTGHSSKPTIRIAFNNMWPPAPLSKNTPISSWPKVIKNKIHFFFHPEDQLKEFGILNEILSEKYSIKVVNTNYDIIIDSVFGNNPLPKTNAIKIFFTGEAISPQNLDSYDLALGFDYIDHPNYIRTPLYYMYPLYNTHNIRSNYNRGICNPKKPYFACFLYSNSGENNPTRFDGAIARNKLFHKLSKYKKVESGGRYLNNLGYMVSREDTSNWLSECKFVISYENQTYKGYMTEKPFLSYFAGAIPIYYGDRTAMKDINEKSMIIEQNFPNQDDMIEYIKKLDSDDELYCKTWNQPIINNPSRNYEVIKKQIADKLNAILTYKKL